MFSLNPKTWSGNLLWISILIEKTYHCAFPLADEWYLVQHRLYPVTEKWCHHGSALSLKQFSPKPLYHKGTKEVPWVKWEKEKFLDASSLLEPHVLPYPYQYGLVGVEIPLGSILGTSPTILSTIPIH